MTHHDKSMGASSPSWVFLASIIGICIIWNPLFIFLFPGILLLFILPSKAMESAEIIVSIVLASWSFWIASFWFLRYLPLSLSSFAWVVVFATIGTAILLTVMNRKIISVRATPIEYGVLIVFVIVLFLRLLPWYLGVTPAGADMSQHTFMTRLIMVNNGVPHSYEPIVPIKVFGAYSAGFHTISALIALFGKSEAYRSTFFVASITHALVTGALYVFLRPYFEPLPALGAAVVATFATENPQKYVSWGGNPTVLAFVFLVYGLHLLREFDRRLAGSEVVLTAFIFTAVLFTHAIPFLAAMYIVPILILFRILISSYEFPVKDAWHRK